MAYQLSIQILWLHCFNFGWRNVFVVLLILKRRRLKEVFISFTSFVANIKNYIPHTIKVCYFYAFAIGKWSWQIDKDFFYFWPFTWFIHNRITFLSPPHAERAVREEKNVSRDSRIFQTRFWPWIISIIICKRLIVTRFVNCVVKLSNE